MILFLQAEIVLYLFIGVSVVLVLFIYLFIYCSDRLCGLVVGLHGCRTEMYCDSCEVLTEFMCVM
jgi:hypothetical protein